MSVRSVVGVALGGLRVAPWLAITLALTPQEPSLRIVEPAEGAALIGPEVTIVMEIGGVELGGQARSAAHVLLTLDELPPLKSLGERFTFQGIDAGEHALRAELRRRDGSSFEPPVVAQRRFRVTDPGR